MAHKIAVAVQPPDPSLAGKELLWELHVSPAEDAANARARSANPEMVLENVKVETAADGIVKVRATPPRTSHGTAQINFSTEGTEASAILKTEIQQPHTSVTLLTPDTARLLPANQESTQLTFRMKDDDLAAENLKFHFNVEPANLVRFDPPPVSGGAERTVTLLRGTGFGKGTITVQVEAGERAISNNYDLQVAANPIVISAPPGNIEMKPAAKEVQFPLGIYDPYTPADEVQPAITADPADIVKVETTHVGTNWTVRLDRVAPGDAKGTLAIRIQGKGEPISTNLPFSLLARFRPAVTVVNQAELRQTIRSLVKLHDPPLRIPCSISGSSQPVWKRRESDNPTLLPKSGIAYEAPSAPGAGGFIVLSPARGKSGKAKIDFDVTADDAEETNFVVQLDVEGEPTAPGLEISPSQVTLEEGGHTNLSVGIKSDYFEPERLTVSDTIEPSGHAALASLPGTISSNFSLALSAGQPGRAEIKFILKDPNGRSAAQSVSARVLQGFRIAAEQTNVAITAGSSKVRLTVFDEPEALQQMRDPEIVSTTGALSARNWTVATTKRDGSNLVVITVSSPGQSGGKDTLVVKATDTFGRKASQSIALAFVQPLINKLGMQLVWVPDLPGVGYAIWKPPGSNVGIPRRGLGGPGEGEPGTIHTTHGNQPQQP